ncbi:translation elongation factor 4 [Ruthenibacterium lactatiformans]|uniref:Elongation factor 4 n=2 Tax=Ruthenibacterium lactatiformans TaxID=1550024 RepID=A0A0D8IZR1_9FIRM|nr:translation elongation factor 4 [Ruthenibacterium lactatiformans]MBP8888897.1 translation elongation factor 4 [Ruthenibacterium sp.]MDY4195639.1 translation elongation factor 4 [Peptoniphilaceae bacterium]RGC98150.1 elongation factor 4 [Subdoligranulum sp. AM16-9]RGD21918.1 elongation factor 4 [Subdoligranulum sp. AM23-21AC]RJV93652.1 elongation factor 4 [Subdoligranulum sp. AF14-43]RJW33140.1 elongation factor 4 [Subdoligranulum sp. TF05-17AC]RJW80582.1 elongation factor 4 [Subdoligranul
MAQKNIRNFCIIAHIDHGKSTLADRILECTQAVDERQMEAQLLDNMELERERGITIKARAVTLHYTAKDGQDYEFNLIDTPGHVDFNYEVSRSLAACEGAVLVVDASQGVEAQTLANTYLALEHDLELVPILNKIDLPSAEPDRVAHEVEDVIGLPCMDAPRVSAKMGVGIQDVLERVITDIPAPKGDADAPLKALIFDAVYDPYKGVIVYLRVFDGRLSVGEPVKLMQTGAQFTPVEVGHMGATALAPCGTLEAGEVGYFTASIKTLEDTRVGDTITGVSAPTAEALPGYRKVTPMVFCGIYPADGADYPDLKDALEKLRLNDASLSFDAETSVALGFGFRCGFLGLLHLEIIIERLEREFDLDLITTAPSVEYRITLTDGAVKLIDNPTNYPDPAQIAKAEEPFVDAHIYTPTDYVGSLMELCQNRRGIMRDMKYMDATRVDLHYELPLGEIVYDFFDAIKSRSRGYASYDYEMKGFVESKLVKLDILLNGDMVDALSMIVHADTAYAKGRRLAEKLKENIPRQMFEIPIQAAIGGKIIARETVKAMRKDVLAKCYGGDITRKKKLLEKQKEGKKKMRQLGTVQVPSEAFTAVLKLDE